MSLRKKVFNRVNRLAQLMGYNLLPIANPATKDADFVLFKYEDEKGDFNYDDYKSVQEQGNKVKINSVWVLEDNIKFLADYLKKNLPASPTFGLCHGTRRGKEQEWFHERLDCEVIGTEISDTAHEFPRTIQWDFHEVKDEWVNNVDFIYSNSLDHSYDPEKCLNAWVSCLKPGGLCIIEHSDHDRPEVSSRLDPFGAKMEIIPYLIAKWGKANYHLREMVAAPKKKDHVGSLYFFVVQKTS